jgi:hypothetical protein
MNILRTAPRLPALGLACSIGLAFLPSAQAAFNGYLLSGMQVPDWAVGNEFGCEGTLITPRVVITSGECKQETGYFHRKTGQKYHGTTINYPATVGVLGSLSIFISDGLFGGSSSIRSAVIANYQEEKKALVDGNDSMTQGTSLEFFTNDGLGMNSGDRASKQMRLVDSYLDWTTYKGGLSSGVPVPDGPPLIYRSLPKYRQLAPSRVGNYGYTYDPATQVSQASRDQDTNDAVILVAGSVDWSPYIESPLGYERGSGLHFINSGGGARLIGTYYRGWANVRLSHYWPWVVKTLADRGLREDALLLSQKVLGTGSWGDNGRQGEIGQIFVNFNADRARLEYFRLIKLDPGINTYGPFPNLADNKNWEYLGTTLPDIEQATTPIHRWGLAGNKQGVAGDIYGDLNPYSQVVEYFRLNKTGPYGNFPINQANNADWTYLGTDLPTRKLKYLQL